MNFLLLNWFILIIANNFLFSEEIKSNEMGLEGLEILLLKEIPKVIVATKTLQNVTDVPSTIYVVDKHDMQNYGLRDLKDVMWMFPGLNLSYQNNWLIGGQRGFTGSFNGTLLLVNGRDYTNMIAGETFISEQYGTYNMKRVELLQGPASALYGTQAMEGVINVVTKIFEERGNNFIDANVLYGDFNAKEINGSFGKTFDDEKGWIGFSGRMSETEGIDQNDFNNWKGSFEFSRNPAFQNARYNPIDPRYRATPLRSARNAEFYAEYSGFYFGGSINNNSIRCSQEYIEILENSRTDVRDNRLFFAGYLFSPIEDLNIKIDAEYRHEDNGPNTEHYRYNDDINNTTPDTWAMPNNKKNKLSVEANYKILKHEITTGVEYTTTESGDSIFTPYYYLNPPREYFGGFTLSGQEDILKDTIKSIYVQDTWDILSNRSLLGTIGLRYDNTLHTTEDITTPRLGLVWHPEELSTIKLMYGKGFRTANIFELSSQLSGGYKTKIPPRTMESYQLEINKKFGGFLNSSLALYQNHGQVYIQKLVASSRVRDDFFYDVSGLDTKGFELTNKIALTKNIGSILNYSYTNPEPIDVTLQALSSSENQTQKVDAFNVPKNQVHFGFYYEFLSKYSLSIFHRWVDKINTQVNLGDGSIDVNGNLVTEIITLDSYTDTNLTINAKNIDLGNAKFIITFGVKNLFDKDNYMNNPRSSGTTKYKQPGREIFTQAGISF